MNILGPKNIAKKILSYIDPFDNCGPQEGLKILGANSNVLGIIWF
jgi:hypothetical protein